MCVLIYKPQNIKLSKEVLTACYKANKDGCGFATQNGFLFKTIDFDKFYNQYKKFENQSLIIHFRFATHGSIKNENCHPFIDNSQKVIFAHNGVLSNIKNVNDKTDSETFFIQKVMPTIKKYGFNSTELNLLMIKNCQFGKFALINEKQIKLFGNFEEYKGCYFSNLRWQHYLFDTRKAFFTQKEYERLFANCECEF